MADKFTVAWTWRSREPARSPANPAYPHGMDLDMALPHLPSCKVPLIHPAPGVGTWVLTCTACGYVATVTAAGRRDDPRSVTLPCKRKVN